MIHLPPSNEVVEYFRTSTQGQDYGLAAQLAMASRWDERHGLTVLDQILEKHSGGNADRVRYQHALSLVENHPGSALVSTRVDRLHRNVFEWAKLDRWARNNPDRNVIIIETDMDVKTSMDRMALNFMATTAEVELEKISSNTKAGVEQARLEGHVSGRKPGVLKGQITVDRIVFVQILEWKKDGTKSRAIRQMLHDMGQISPTGQEWWPLSTIDRVTPAYLDAIRYENHTELKLLGLRGVEAF